MGNVPLHAPKLLENKLELLLQLVHLNALNVIRTVLIKNSIHLSTTREDVIASLIDTPM